MSDSGGLESTLALFHRKVRVVHEPTGEVIEVRLADEEGNGTALDVALALVPHFEVWIDLARMKVQSVEVRISTAVEVVCLNCSATLAEHCSCHRSCPGQCPPEDSSDRVYRTFEAKRSDGRPEATE